MKKLQTHVLKILILAALPCLVPIYLSATPAGDLAKADSLFRLKQYTQSFELYQKLFLDKKYSPAMLLKMAYIQEGLGRLAPSMYYLNLYYLVTNDEQALTKIEETALKNKLEGYDDSDAARLWTILREYYWQILWVILSICFFLLAFLLYQKVRLKRSPIPIAVILVFFLILLFAHDHLSKSTTQGIIASPSTYLMSGPSAGSSVVGIVGEGHRLEILGSNDIWLRVKWIDKEVYVKERELLPVRL
jgi:hypothetical protein